MLTQLWVRNFKLHARSEVRCAPITVFIGPNNSGKSSLLQAVLLLRQAAIIRSANLCRSVERQQTGATQHFLFAPEQIVDLGLFEHVLRHGESEIGLGLVGRVRAKKPLALAPGPTSVHFELGVRENALAYHKGGVGFEVHAQGVRSGLYWEWTRGRPAETSSPSVDISGANLSFSPGETFRMIGPAGVGFQGSLDQITQLNVMEFQVALAEAPCLLLRSIHPVFPLRGFEEAGYPLTEEPPREIERMAVADRTLALASLLAYDRNLQERVSDWLEELIGLRIKTTLMPGKKVSIMSSATNKRMEKLFLNEGSGTGQLPFILIPIGISDPGDSVWLLEPEAHLHPKAQSALAALLVQVLKRDERQFFIETHSEHILHSLLHARARGELNEGDMAIFYFECKEETAQIRQLTMDEKGRIEGGLPGFFEHSVEELSEYLETLRNK